MRKKTEGMSMEEFERWADEEIRRLRAEVKMLRKKAELDSVTVCPRCGHDFVL